MRRSKLTWLMMFNLTWTRSLFINTMSRHLRMLRFCCFHSSVAMNIPADCSSAKPRVCFTLNVSIVNCGVMQLMKSPGPLCTFCDLCLAMTSMPLPSALLVRNSFFNLFVIYYFVLKIEISFQKITNTLCLLVDFKHQIQVSLVLDKTLSPQLFFNAGREAELERIGLWFCGLAECKHITHVAGHEQC